MSSSHSRLSDGLAVGLSGLCLAHCLALPVVVAALPALGAFSEAAWVHMVFLAAAIPASYLALRGVRPPRGLFLLVTSGLLLLAAGSVHWGGHELAEGLTVAGSLLLVAGHLWNWRRRAADGQAAVQPPSTARIAPFTEAPASETR